METIHYLIDAGEFVSMKIVKVIM